MMHFCNHFYAFKGAQLKKLKESVKTLFNEFGTFIETIHDSASLNKFIFLMGMLE